MADEVDRGLFGGHHHGRRNEYSEEAAYASELGGGYGRPPPSVRYEEEGVGYGRPPPVAYEGQGGFGGGYEDRPPMYERQGGGYGGGGYAEEGYGRRPGYGEVSDLGTGLTGERYETGYRRSEIPGEYEERRHHDRREEDEYEEERKHKRYAEEAAVAALGYGLYERHERKDDEERLEDLGYDEDGRKKHGHHLFRSDS